MKANVKMDKITCFKKELHDLLKKYNAAISCNVKGHTHCLSYKMVVDFGSKDKWKKYELLDSNEFDSEDIAKTLLL